MGFFRTAASAAESVDAITQLDALTVQGYQALTKADCNRVGLVYRIEFFIDGFLVDLDGSFRNGQTVSDLTRGFATGHKAQYFKFSLAEG